MKQNTFYILVGIIGLVLFMLFGVSIRLSNPFIIAAAFIVGAVLYFYFKKQVTDSSHDERQNMIDMKTASATLKAFFVSFFTVNLATVVYVFSVPLGIHKVMFTRSIPGEMAVRGSGQFDLMNNLNASEMNSVAITIHTEAESSAVDVVYNVTTHAIQLIPAPPEMIAVSHLGIFGAIQILLLILMLFIYVGFRVYYSHQLGEWDDDEE